jgi:hypothetical protein
MYKNKKAILCFADILKWEFFTRLKDETAPAGKEFSYVDLLDILDEVYWQVGISKKDIEEHAKRKPITLDDMLAWVPAELREAYEAGLKKALIKPTDKTD